MSPDRRRPRLLRGNSEDRAVCAELNERAASFERCVQRFSNSGRRAGWEGLVKGVGQATPSLEVRGLRPALVDGDAALSGDEDAEAVLVRHRIGCMVDASTPPLLSCVPSSQVYALHRNAFPPRSMPSSRRLEMKSRRTLLST